MTTAAALRPARSVRAILITIMAGAALYVVAVGAYVALRLAPSAATLRVRAGALGTEYDSLRSRSAMLQHALAGARRLSGGSALADSDRAQVRGTRQALARVAEQAAGVQASLLLPGISPAMRAALAEAAGAESHLAGALMESLDYVDLGDFAAARARVASAEAAREALAARLEDAQRAGLVDLAERERVLGGRANRVIVAIGVWVVLGTTLLALALAVVHRLLYVPLEALERGLARVEQGDLQASLPVRRDDELGRLTAHFNQMTGVLRERTEIEALHRSEERFRALIEQAPVAITLSRDGVGLYANPALLRMMGLRRPEEAVGRAIADFFAPSYRREIVERIARRTQGLPVPAELEAVAVRADGSEFPIHVAVATVRLADGPAALSFVTDISGRKQAEEAQRVSEEKFTKVFMAVPAGISVSHVEDGHLIEVNDEFCRIFGYAREELVGRSTIELGLWLSPQDRERHVAQLRADGTVKDSELRLRAKGGEIRTLRTAAHTLQLDGESLLLSTFVDVTERVRLEAQLRQAQKMEAVGQLAGGVAHDFNHLLATILTCSELVAADHPADSPSREDLEALRTATRRGAELTRNLLAFSRQQALELRAVPLGQHVKAFVRMARRVVPDDVEIALEVEDPEVVAWADPGAVDQILMNLVTNARDAMPQGGQLTLGASRVEVPEADARAAGGEAGTYARLTVSDTGAGMDAETARRIFEPFFTTKAVGRGTGLGMPMVYGLARQHGGFVEIDSEPGRGTVVRVYLRVAPDQGAAAPPAEQPALRGGTETVLLVEDNAGLRRATARALEKRGYTVITAPNGAEALRLLEEGARPALIISDVVMPQMGGLKLREALGHLGLDTKLLLISGYAATDLSELKQLGGAQRFLTKPWEMGELLEAVRETIDG